MAAPQAIHDGRKKFHRWILFSRFEFTPPSSIVQGPRVIVHLGPRKISPSSSQSQPRRRGFSLTLLSPVASAAPPSANDSAVRRRCHHRAPPPPLHPPEWHLTLGGWHRRRRHAILGFQCGTGLGPDSGGALVRVPYSRRWCPATTPRSILTCRV